MIFHYVAELDATPDIKPSANIATAEWFSFDQLPPASEVAHHGWALHTLKAISAQ